MKNVFLLAVCIFAVAAKASAQNNVPQFKLPPPNDNRNLPTITGSGGGSRKQGFDVNLDAKQRIWESNNRRHSLDASAGYSQHLGGPYGNSRPDYRGGVGYTYTFG